MIFNAPSSKMEIIGLLAVRHRLSRYLEVCTSTTGAAYNRLDRAALTTAHRLMYNCPADFDDGLAVDFRSGGLDIGQCLAEIRGKGLRYDIVLVDPFHEYETSYRDLVAAFDLIGEGGCLVVHDCLPPNADAARPEFVSGTWCGVTYKAFLDFVRERRWELDHQTVDVDYGCGIVRKLDRWSRWIKRARSINAACLGSGPQRAEHGHHRLLWQQWREIGDDFDQAYGFFARHKNELLNVISPAQFSAMLQN